MVFEQFGPIRYVFDQFVPQSASALIRLCYLRVPGPRGSGKTLFSIHYKAVMKKNDYIEHSIDLWFRIGEFCDLARSPSLLKSASKKYSYRPVVSIERTLRRRFISIQLRLCYHFPTKNAPHLAILLRDRSGVRFSGRFNYCCVGMPSN